MPVLARMVLDMAERLQASAADAFAVGQAEGASRAAGYAAYPSALEALVDDLDRLGFDPVVAESDDPDNAIVAFANCPFAVLRRRAIPTSCAASTMASSPASSTRWATPRSPSSARSPTARRARSS